MCNILILCLLSQTMNIDELSAQLHLETGNAYLQQGLLGQAEEEFLTALELCEDCHLAILGLGELYFKRSSLSRASGYFREYIEIQPLDYRGYFGLSRLYLWLDSPDSALIMADSAFLRSPTTPEIWLLSGKAELLTGDTLSAELWFVKGISAPGSTGLESLVLLASIYRTTERGAEARELLLPVVDLDFAPACWELAKVYLGWKDYMRASDAISHYLRLSPSGIYADSAFLVLDELGESGAFIP